MEPLNDLADYLKENNPLLQAKRSQQMVKELRKMSRESKIPFKGNNFSSGLNHYNNYRLKKPLFLSSKFKLGKISFHGRIFRSPGSKTHCTGMAVPFGRG